MFSAWSLARLFSLRLEMTILESLATVTLPVGDKSDIVKFSSAISDPPMVKTEFPALTETQYGRGRVIFSAGCIEQDAVADNETLFLNLIGRLLGEPRITLQAHSCVDHVLYEGKDCLKLHLLNHQTALPVIPIADVGACIRLEAGQRVRAVRDALGGEIAWKQEGDLLQLHTDLAEYKLLLIKL